MGIPAWRIFSLARTSRCRSLRAKQETPMRFVLRRGQEPLAAAAARALPRQWKGGRRRTSWPAARPEFPRALERPGPPPPFEALLRLFVGESWRESRQSAFAAQPSAAMLQDWQGSPVAANPIAPPQRPPTPRLQPPPDRGCVRRERRRACHSFCVPPFRLWIVFARHPRQPYAQATFAAGCAISHTGRTSMIP